MEENFYEREEVTHEVVESERSESCGKLIRDYLATIRTCQATNMLDLGCGDGSVISKFGTTAHVYGIDISEQAVKKARMAGVESFRVDISSEKLPFQDAFFDIVYFGDVIEHLTDPDFAIAEVHRVLKASGVLLLSTPNLASWLNRLLLFVGYQPLFSEVSTKKIFGRKGSIPVGHLRLFTFRALKEFLAFHGFHIIESRGAAFEKLPRFASCFDKMFSAFPSLSSVIIVRAQRE
jgi:SAM-dependent methyltransferase